MQAKRRALRPRGEHGYALLSLLAAMTIAAIVLASAMEPPKHRMQREKEEEMLWRGAQVAQAIARFHNRSLPPSGPQQEVPSETVTTFNPAFLPAKLEDLTKEITYNGKKQYLIRPSAMRDPMTGDEDWRPVRLGDPLVAEFYSAFSKYVAEQSRTASLPPEALIRLQTSLELLKQAAVYSGAQIVPSGAGKDGSSPQETPSAFSSLQATSSFSLNPESRPIIAVVSRSKEKLIRNYFGLENYDHALFFPGVQRPGGMMLFAVGGAGGIDSSQGGVKQGKPAPLCYCKRNPDGSCPCEGQGR